jgi:16S rRNA (uracil1498-N3)-methyltransferase
VSSLYLRDDLAALAPREGDIVTLSGDEARHAATVGRMRVGEHTAFGDGRGLVVRGIVTAVAPREVSLAVESVEEHPAAAPSVVLVQALAKGDRDELAVQAATELGVSAVVPWQADRSVSRWEGAKAAKGIERWSAIVREAAKQSIRARIPAVDPLVRTTDLAKTAGQTRMLVLEPTAEGRLSDLDLTPGASDAAKPIHLVVGPEGGISPRELDLLQSAGARLVRLGPDVLRTSTAGPAALAVVNVALGRW